MTKALTDNTYWHFCSSHHCRFATGKKKLPEQVLKFKIGSILHNCPDCNSLLFVKINGKRKKAKERLFND